MKTASKVFNWISLVYYVGMAIYCLVMGIAGANAEVGNYRFGPGYFYGCMVVYIIGVAVSSIVLYMIDKLHEKNGRFICLGIVDILFGSLLGGIFLLCTKEEELY